MRMVRNSLSFMSDLPHNQHCVQRNQEEGIGNPASNAALRELRLIAKQCHLQKLCISTHVIALGRGIVAPDLKTRLGRVGKLFFQLILLNRRIGVHES